MHKGVSDDCPCFIPTQQCKEAFYSSANTERECIFFLYSFSVHRFFYHVREIISLFSWVLNREKEQRLKRAKKVFQASSGMILPKRGSRGPFGLQFMPIYIGVATNPSGHAVGSSCSFNSSTVAQL
jgi:hypothetical protein